MLGDGEVILVGRDATPLRDADEIEFVTMLSGG